MSVPTLNERAQRLLKTLVECYIREGQPVGSKTLVEKAALPVSPATVRNIMAELEERGFVASPHTSAGRIPTEQGYRVFVDNLVTFSPLEQRQLAQITGELSADKTAPELVEAASRLLSDFSRMTGVVAVPKRRIGVLRQVEFLPLAGNRVLVILVLNQREVQNQIIHTDREYSESDLRQAANFVNQHFAGLDIDAMRQRMLELMRADKEHMDLLMQQALDMAGRALDAQDRQPDVKLAGESNLIAGLGAETGIDRIRDLFDAFQRKRDILDLMDRCSAASGVKIFIGSESGYEAFADCSIITAPYGRGGDALGVLAVVGPTRMAYERVVPLVDITARLLGAALNPRDPA
ncbi:MAG: heat-inducible transcriptional repressor HrcA [Pseudomonadota bacterium]